jgi:[protein-PII] uridylyltransferase
VADSPSKQEAVRPEASVPAVEPSPAAGAESAADGRGPKKLDPGPWAIPVALPDPVSFGGKLSDIAREYVAAVRAELERRHFAGADGTASARYLTRAVDELIRFILDVTTERFSRRYARAHQRCAVIAQGGYGRADMSPYSDVDLLIIYPGRITPYVETVSERLIQTLWDAQLHVGSAVRTVRDCVDQASRDLTVKTTLLDGRFLCGSTELGAQFTEACQDVLASRDIQAFIDEKLLESRERHAHLGGSVFLLEPNVKDGQGGLRDLHTLVWIGRMLRGVLSLEGFADTGLTSESEQRELMSAYEFLLRVRHSLHFMARFKQDKLSFESQEKIAEQFGYRPGETHSAVDLFMRDYYSYAAIVSRSVGDIVARMVAPPEPSGLINRLSSRSLREGVTVVGGQLVVEERILEDDAVNLLRIFSDAQRCDVSLSSGTSEAVRRNAKLLTAELAQSDEAIDVFMGILKWHDGVYGTLGEMNRLGVLGRLIPEFGRLFCMVQHDFYHVYTVDEHSLIGIRELERLRDGVYARDSPLLTQVMRECDHPELLFLAMMFHDLGKGYGGDHDERGAVMVHAIAERLRLHEDHSATLEFLVRQHLTMSMLAQNRDIDDTLLVSDFVSQVGTLENLRYLYLLTFADMKAVGPLVWTGWKDHLLGELFLRAADVFDKGVVTEKDLETRVERAKRRVIARVTGEAELERLDEFLAGMPPSYFLRNDEDVVIDHWRLYESLGKGLFRSGVHHVPERGFTEFTVCTRDRPGLFVRLAGVLSARHLNILSAKIVTSGTHVVIDTFRIDHAGTDVNPLDADVWAAVRSDIEGVLAGDLDVEKLVAAAEASRPAPSSVRKARRRAMTRVDIDNDVSRGYTVIDVYAADRSGLLFALTNSIFRLGLVIHLAKITTHVHQVLDVFYVTDADGRKIVDPERSAEIERAILAQISDPDQPAATPAAGPAPAS